ncbi:MAG: nuclear transport factor 2 family protein [Pseudomonadota bacterium]
MRTSLLLAALTTSAITALAATSLTGPTESLHALNDRFNSAIAEGDVQAVLDLYADDTLWIEQGKPAVQGLDAPRQLFEFVTANRGKVTHTVDTLFVAGDASLAVMIGSVEAKLEAANLDATGTYLFVLEPNGDNWQVVTDMWHQHQPAAE